MTDDADTGDAGRTPDWRGAAAIADARVELAAVRTGLALERTRMSADRTLMAVMRTSLALIGFGFAIFEYFHMAAASSHTVAAFPDTDARNLGFLMVALGLGVLGPGIMSHTVFQHRLRRQRDVLASRGLVPPHLDLPGSVASALAAMLFALGVAAIIRMAMRAGVF